jgi:nickel superoxide dismutase
MMIICELPCSKNILPLSRNPWDKSWSWKKSSNSNQLVRWIMNKEDHVDKFQHIVTQYFLTQRLKSDTKDYDTKLDLLHQILVYAMKYKQTTDMANMTRLKELVKEFDKLYFAPHN